MSANISATFICVNQHYLNIWYIQFGFAHYNLREVMVFAWSESKSFERSSWSVKLYKVRNNFANFHIWEIYLRRTGWHRPRCFHLVCQTDFSKKKTRPLLIWRLNVSPLLELLCSTLVPPYKKLFGLRCVNFLADSILNLIKFLLDISQTEQHDFLVCNSSSFETDFLKVLQWLN